MLALLLDSLEADSEEAATDEADSLEAEADDSETLDADAEASEELEPEGSPMVGSDSDVVAVMDEAEVVILAKPVKLVVVSELTESVPIDIVAVVELVPADIDIMVVEVDVLDGLGFTLLAGLWNAGLTVLPSD